MKTPNIVKFSPWHDNFKPSDARFGCRSYKPTCLDKDRLDGKMNLSGICTETSWISIWIGVVEGFERPRAGSRVHAMLEFCGPDLDIVGECQDGMTTCDGDFPFAFGRRFMLQGETSDEYR
jgi:hypothetical protein